MSRPATRRGALTALARAVLSRWQPSDRLVVLGNVLGPNGDPARTLDGLLPLRRRVMAASQGCGILFLRGAQEHRRRPHRRRRRRLGRRDTAGPRCRPRRRRRYRRLAGSHGDARPTGRRRARSCRRHAGADRTLVHVIGPRASRPAHGWKDERAWRPKAHVNAPSPLEMSLYGSTIFTCGRRASSAALSTPFRTSSRSILKSP